MKGAENLPSDVRTVQELLNNVPQSEGGPKVPLIVDGICGTKTKSTIQDFQLHHFGWQLADGRVDPNGPTLGKLNEYEPSTPDYLGQQIHCSCLPFPQASRLAIAEQASLLSPAQQALRRVPDALLWVRESRDAISKMIGVYQNTPTPNPDTLLLMLEYDALAIHFKIHQASNKLAWLMPLRNHYDLIGRALNKASNVFIDDMNCGDSAVADLGGFLLQQDEFGFAPTI
jgi:hypothetical protein